MKDRIPLPSSKSQHIRGELVRYHRDQKGWTQEELAHAAGISTKTVENAEQSKRMLHYIIRQIATALDLQYEDLVDRHFHSEVVSNENDQSVVADEDRIIGVAIVFDVEWSRFDLTEELLNKLNRMAKTVGAVGEIGVRYVKKGSVIIEAEILREDVPRFLEAFDKGRLDWYSVSAIAIPREAVIGLIPPGILGLTLVGSLLAAWLAGLSPVQLLPLTIALNDIYKNLRVDVDSSGRILFRRRQKPPPPPEEDPSSGPSPYRPSVSPSKEETLATTSSSKRTRE